MTVPSEDNPNVEAQGRDDFDQTTSVPGNSARDEDHRPTASDSDSSQDELSLSHLAKDGSYKTDRPDDNDDDDEIADRSVTIIGAQESPFGRYEILDELGRGGFGIVHLAFDPVLRRKVAIKAPQGESACRQGEGRVPS